MWIDCKKKDASIIFDLFNGQLRSSLKCQRCVNISSIFEVFSCIQLSIPIEKLLFVPIKGLLKYNLMSLLLFCNLFKYFDKVFQKFEILHYVFHLILVWPS